MIHPNWQALLDRPGHPKDTYNNYLSIVGDIKELFQLSEFSEDEKGKVREFLSECISLESQRVAHYQKWSGENGHYDRLIEVLGFQVYYLENLLDELK